MAIRVGNRNANILNGTSRNDLILGLNGDDTINAGGGHDLVFAGAGNDRIFAGDGNDWIFAGTGNDMAYGGNGNDYLFGEAGNDVLDGGRGSDWVDGGSGSDTLIFTDAERGGLDRYVGGSGQDTLVLEFASGRWADAAVKAEVLAYLNFLSSGGTGNFTFSTMNLVVSSLETLVVKVDGVIIDPLASGNTVPTGTADTYTTGENGVLNVPSTGLASLVSNDSTGNGAFSVQVVTGPANGALTLNTDGTFSYNPGTAFDYLAAGQTAVETFTYGITNSAGTSAPITVSLNIAGANDAATISGVLSGTVQEDNVDPETEEAILTASGQVSVTDADNGQQTVGNPGTYEGTYGSLILNADGSWIYTIDNSRAATQALGAGAAAIETFEITSVDGSAASAITVIVNGTNDAATFTGNLTGSVQEDSNSSPLTANGQILVSDADAGQSSISNAGTYAGAYGSLALQADGNWIYTLNNGLPAVQSLGEGDSATEEFEVVSQDGSTTQLVITVLGTNDEPLVGGFNIGFVSEDGSTPDNESGTLIASDVVTVNDADAGESGFANPGVYEGEYGSLLLAADGTWTYTLNNDSPAVQALRGTETGGALETINVYTIDGTQVPIIILIEGVNDTADISGSFSDTIYLAFEDSTANGFVTVVDIDTDESGVAAGFYNGTYGDLTMNADGSWSYEFTAFDQVGGEEPQSLAENFELQTLGGDYFNVYVEIADGFLPPS